jgi:hypothetical protein
MVDAEMSFSPVDMALPARDRRLAPLTGLGFAVLVSIGLWGLLALGASQLF